MEDRRDGRNLASPPKQNDPPRDFVRTSALQWLKPTRKGQNIECLPKLYLTLPPTAYIHYANETF